MLTAEQIIALRLPDATIPAGYLELALTLVPACIPEGQDKELAIALAAMHLYSLDQQAQSGSMASGPVMSEKEGDLSVSYGAVVGVRSDLASTPYGVELNRLISAYGPRVLTRFTSGC